MDIGVRGKNELGSGAILLLGALAVHQGRPDGDADLTALQSTKVITFQCILSESEHFN